MLKIFKRDRPTDTGSTQGNGADSPIAASAMPVPVETANPGSAASAGPAASAASAASMSAPPSSSNSAAVAASAPPKTEKLPSETTSVARTSTSLTPARSVLDGVTSASFEPLRGVIGTEQARETLVLLRRLEPRSAVFVIAPRTSVHGEAIRTLLAENAAAIPVRDAVVVVPNYASTGGEGGLVVLRLPAGDAASLASGVAAVIEMLSATIPAAFDSDSYRVARIALDEELRSGHDSALDALRRKALTQNIGLLRTTNGFAVVPMHDGRVVRGEIYGALPGSLKSDVEAKLAVFEAELADVLRNRAVLQQDHYARAKALERDAASLAVDAAVGPLKKAFSGREDVVRWLCRLADDLVANAQVFVAAARVAQGAPRAPCEIAQDPSLQRYRVGVLSRGARGSAGLEFPETLDRAEMLGLARTAADGSVLPAGVSPGALTRPGGGVVVVDVRDLMANYGSWPLIKHALKSARGAPLATGDGADARAAPIDLPVEVRLVVLGEADDYRSWCRLDPDVVRMFRTIEAFASVLPASDSSERTIACYLSGFVRDDGLLPFDGPAIAAVVATLRVNRDGFAYLTTDLTGVRDLMGLASAEASSSGRLMVLSDDVSTALATQNRLVGIGAPTPGGAGAVA